MCVGMYYVYITACITYVNIAVILDTPKSADFGVLKMTLQMTRQITQPGWMTAIMDPTVGL